MALDRQHVIERLERPEGSRDLSGLDLTGADLSRMDLRGVDFARADLTSADLRWAVLEGADLDSTVLRRADLRWAILRGAQLRAADLVRANLGWADLAGADLRGADLDGANLDNVNLDEAVLETPGARRRAVRGRTARAAAPAGEPLTIAGRSLPQASATVVAGVLIGALAVVFLWGWLFRRAYFEQGFALPDAGLARLGDAGNLGAGALHVLPLEIGLLLLAPLLVVGLLLVLALVAAVPFLFARLSERVLADVVRPEVRPLVIGGLFVAMTVFFVLFLGPALSFAREASGGAVPKSSALSAVVTLFSIGGWWVKLGYLGLLALGAVVLWVAVRALAHFLSVYQIPSRWRVRYPALGSTLQAIRDSRVMAFADPLTAVERRRGLAAAAALVVLLGTVLTGVGRVYAYRDMCDGGDLPRGQLFVNGTPTDSADRLMCERLVGETDDAYFAFFPHQTVESEPGNIASRSASVQSVEVSDTVAFVVAPGPEDDCPGCGSSPEARAAYRPRFVIDPAEVEVAGTVLEHAGDLLTLDVPAGQIGTVRLSATTTLLQDGQTVVATALQPGTAVSAVGRLAADAPILDARLVEIIPLAAPAQVAQITAALDDPQAMVISGTGFQPGTEVAIGLGATGSSAPTQPLVLEPVTTDAEGTFSVPVRWREGLPTGPGWQIIARDPARGQFATATWLSQAPPPTATPRPTPSPIIVEEMGGQTATPPAGGGTPPPESEVTNTPLPTRLIPGGGAGVGDCEGDTYEPDWPRGFEKEIFVGFGETATTQSHTFCGRGARFQNDIDLAFFSVKRDRWYRVKTANLGPGVDTVMAVGDLSNSTDCYPAGCWSDDRGALTYESEIVFHTVEDGRAMITVDNRGSAYGTSATYDLSVAEFQPEPTATPTVAGTATATATPTATRTPLPFKDLYEVGNRCREDEIYGPATANDYLFVNHEPPYYAVISDRTDDDYYEIEPLVPGAYDVVLRPPRGQDYDVELLVVTGRTSCARVVRSANYGEGVEELIRLSAVSGARYVVHVYSAYPSIYYDAYNPYALAVRTETGAPPPTATPSPTATLTPTITPSPTITPTPPAPEGDILPPRATSTP